MLRLFIISLLFASLGWSANAVYIAQTAQGGGTGADCADALADSYFNTAGNWSATPTGIQIGPDTTVHLCGTFTVTAGGTELTVQGSGSSGHPVIIFFESGANFTATYFNANGAILSTSKNYITFNGNNTGVIATTANGTGLANQQNTAGIKITNCTGCTVENITLGPMYVRTCVQPVSNCTDENGQSTEGLWVTTGANNLTITNVTAHDAHWCLYAAGAPSATDSNWTITHNTAYFCDHGIAIAGNSVNGIISGVTIANNTIHDGANWDDAGVLFHHDAIHVFYNVAGGSVDQLAIYNNYIYGDWGTNMNSFTYIESAGSAGGQTWIFNNLYVNGTTLSHVGCGTICLYGTVTPLIANNTIIANNTSNDSAIDVYQPNNTIYNNLVQTIKLGAQTSTANAVVNTSGTTVTYVSGNSFNTGTAWNGNVVTINSVSYTISSVTSTTQLTLTTSAGTQTSVAFVPVTLTPNTWDYNLYYNLPTNGWNNNTYTIWQGNGFDAHAVNGSNPLLTAGYTPTATSPARGAATNLYSTCNGQPNPGLGALCNDAHGIARPTVAAWDIGAYQYTPPNGVQVVGGIVISGNPVIY